MDMTVAQISAPAAASPTEKLRARRSRTSRKGAARALSAHAVIGAELAFLDGGGEMGARMRAFDWAQTPLGSPAGWPQSLKAAITFCLGSRFPIVIWWNRDLAIQFYNDAYISFLGPSKHPVFLGRSGQECWREIMETMGPQWEKVYHAGEATWSEDFLYVIDRKLPREEGYFTYSYSPIRGNSGTVEGIFCACYETTGKVVGARRLETLRRLGEQAMEADSVADACARATTVLDQNPHDIPFARIYSPDSNGKFPSDALAVEALASITETRRPVELTGLQLPGGAWPEPATQAVVLPLLSSTNHNLAGLIVVGISPRRPLDAEYRAFLNLIAGHVATAMANAHAREEERKRAEALAEIDRAKTAFFSNVSHEFRTPLTLMLGPLEELRTSVDLTPAMKEQVETAHRNSLRLLRLVNTLLNFSRIEAGRVDAVYEPTDLGTYTTELASAFRAATDRAGLKLTVDCPGLAEPVYVDRGMWEKIVLNLVSNAFKFTLEGEIEVNLRSLAGAVELRVRDTGVGIPEEEMPRLFERFHRGEKTRSRTHEGSGIGLALVQELVKLHGGSVRAESRLGQGTVFTVTVPKGRNHLPQERIGTREAGEAPLGPVAFVEEALRWLPEDGAEQAQVKPVESPDELLPVASADEGHEGQPPLVLVADDNADMRQYLARLLRKQYRVQVAADGAAALAKALEQPPDLVLTDVMMPHLDGLELVRRLRADPGLKTVPIILLSARAGEESQAEGLEQGADDYLTKPFSAQELKARVAAHLKMACLRKEAKAVLVRSNDELERLVRERTAKLTEMAAELQQISYAMVHDMRAPLRAMIGFAGALQDICAQGASPEDLQGHCRRIIMGASRLDRLITDALSYTKSVLAEAPCKRVELATLMREMLESYPNLWAEKAEIRIEGELPAVMGEESLLVQVFSNLLGNAVKFVNPGVRPSVRVWAEITGPQTEKPESNAGAPESRRYARIWVEDNGIGISRNAQPRLFGLFQKLDRTHEGTGIGLAIVRKVTERMGGKVGAESEVGKGSRFWVQLPLAD